MAEVINPIPVASAISALTIVTPKLLLVRAVYWYNPATAGDLANFVDNYGNVIIPLRCEVDNQSLFYELNIMCDGINCDDLDSGTVYIYTR